MSVLSKSKHLSISFLVASSWLFNAVSGYIVFAGAFGRVLPEVFE